MNRPALRIVERCDGAPVDYAPVDCFQAFENAERERKALARRARLSAIIEWSAVALVSIAAIYFAVELMAAV